MSAQELDELHDDIERLEEVVRELKSNIRDLNLALKGSSAFDTLGVFKRLQIAEQFAKECDDKVHQHMQKMQHELTMKMLEQAREIEAQIASLHGRVDMNTKLFTEHLIEVENFKQRINRVASFIRSMFTNKNFYKMLAAILTLITYDNLKEWGIADWLKEVFSQFLNLFK